MFGGVGPLRFSLSKSGFCPLQRGQTFWECLRPSDRVAKLPPCCNQVVQHACPELGDSVCDKRRRLDPCLMISFNDRYEKSPKTIRGITSCAQAFSGCYCCNRAFSEKMSPCKFNSKLPGETLRASAPHGGLAALNPCSR